jgi:hypothetical protein
MKKTKKNPPVDNLDLIDISKDMEPCLLGSGLSQSSPMFPDYETALSHYYAEAKKFEVKYGKSFDELWLESENASKWTEDMSEIHGLQRRIHACIKLGKLYDKQPRS